MKAFIEKTIRGLRILLANLKSLVTVDLAQEIEGTDIILERIRERYDSNRFAAVEFSDAIHKDLEKQRTKNRELALRVKRLEDGKKKTSTPRKKK